MRICTELPPEISVEVAKLLDLREEQIAYFYGWLKLSYFSLTRSIFSSGQALVFAGPRDCGKLLYRTTLSRQYWVTGMAKPYQFMAGIR